uniref:Retrotransposon gag domain-containing protein n=1 Tax=Hyaloperonospora arabidopsidis (strain Emoy2) TaxID=559515 RepID=M4C2Z3_HYAAE
MSNLAGRAKAWALGLKLHDPYAFGSYNDFMTRLRQTFEPPRAEFRARDELLNLRQDELDLHAYAQHTRYCWFLSGDWTCEGEFSWEDRREDT